MPTSGLDTSAVGVAVVIPTRDYARFLADAVTSALAQTRPGRATRRWAELA